MWRRGFWRLSADCVQIFRNRLFSPVNLACVSVLGWPLLGRFFGIFSNFFLGESVWYIILRGIYTAFGVPMGLASRGGDVFDINQPSLPTPFYSVLVSVSVFMALWSVFRSKNSPDNSLLFHSVLPVLFLPYWSFQLSISLWKSPSALM